MSNILLDYTDERIKTILDCFEGLQKCFSIIKANKKQSLNGEIFITDKELSERLKVCRRTLQEYRDNGLLPFYQLGGKILYKESDIQRVLESAYRKGFDY